MEKPCRKGPREYVEIDLRNEGEKSHYFLKRGMPTPKN